MIDLYQACADIVSQVPRGRVTTYGAVAKALGDPIAKRAVGVMLNTYAPPIKMPCHRVVYSGGGLGGFAHGLGKKMEMLADEGVLVENGRIADFWEMFFDDFKTTYPLMKARAEQVRLAEKVVLKDPSKMPTRVLGLDASYMGVRAFAVGVLFDIKNKIVIKKLMAEDRVTWPYIPTYLGFREIPVFRPIIEEAGDDFIIMVDGNGILHPFGFGLASHIGVECGLPSVGVAKKLLCGEVVRENGEGASPVVLDRKYVGAEVRTSIRAKPVYVSPGHMMSLGSAVKVALAASGFKVPEPIRLAHIEAKAMRGC